jgi:hypothetical protein
MDEERIEGLLQTIANRLIVTNACLYVIAVVAVFVLFLILEPS